MVGSGDGERAQVAGGAHARDPSWVIGEQAQLADGVAGAELALQVGPAHAADELVQRASGVGDVELSRDARQ